MDLYTLDGTLRRSEIIDVYESLIWTERYAAYGDFELVIRSDRGTRALLPVGTRLAIAESKRIMTVETVENGTDDDGVATLKISGRSLEAVLLGRTNTNPWIWLGNNIPNGFVHGPAIPGDIARFLFDSICRNNPEVPQDNIPFITTGSLYTPGNIPESSTVITMTFDFEPLYDSIKHICEIYKLGFRLYRGPDTQTLYFDIYTGNDLTTLQTVKSPVVFSPSLDNLADTNELTAISNIKTVAYVNSVNGSTTVYANGYDGTVSGFARQVLVVDATDIDIPAGTALQNAMIQRGKEELAKYKPVIAFDGEIPQSGSYVYEKDYFLGDLIEMRNEDGLSTNMRVEEQIFVSDKTGKKSYPTFVTELLITPGSWLAWDTAQVWQDATGTWSEA